MTVHTTDLVTTSTETLTTTNTETVAAIFYDATNMTEANLFKVTVGLKTLSIDLKAGVYSAGPSYERTDVKIRDHSAKFPTNDAARQFILAAEDFLKERKVPRVGTLQAPSDLYYEDHSAAFEVRQQIVLAYNPSRTAANTPHASQAACFFHPPSKKLLTNSFL